MTSRTLRAIAIAVFLVLVAVPMTALAAEGDQATEVKVVATTQAQGSPLLGETVTVDVWVSNVANLYGADIRLTFDPTRFVVVDADENAPGVQIQPRADLLSPDFVVRQVAVNKLGTIWYAVTQLNPRAAATGSGPLFSFTVQTTAAGVGTIDVAQQLLITRDLTVVDAASIGAAIDVRPSETQATPRVRLPSVVIGQ